MRLHAECKMTLTASEDCPVVARMRPRSGQAQWMVSEVYQVRPWVPTTEYVDSYGNLCQRLMIPKGEMRIEVSTIMETEEVIAVAPDAGITPIPELPSDVLVYLLQSRYCPSDKMAYRAREITRDVAPGYPQVEAIRAWIRDNVEYRYGVSDGSTDALDTLAVGSGVCRDFAHIGAALCRALHIPARMVVGYLYELDPMDMHAWFEAWLGGRWYTFDATQMKRRGGRLVVAYGRDAADVAFLSNYGPLEVRDIKVTVDCLARET
ncbi:transglutaminase family protein [Variovorax sp. J22R133]|uniref:transglutaminase family protein n=1 Tax=Variovorax brevis TaxID=3053503 RepID=UPI002577BFE2|nr:transglutaminase family protein [Variovorax sp. J22R133]MDM0116248.1 transglutaminase family protein [Variovorax sp. J22R133]